MTGFLNPKTSEIVHFFLLLRGFRRVSRGHGISGSGLEQVALCAREYITRQQTWLILADCSNAFNTLNEADCCASGGSHLRAGAYTVRGKMSRRDACARVLLDGIGRKAEDRLLQRGATTRGCHGAGVVLHSAPAGA